jgi:hypothetical protein
MYRKPYKYSQTRKCRSMYIDPASQQQHLSLCSLSVSPCCICVPSGLVPVIQLQPNSTTPSGTNTIRASNVIHSGLQDPSRAISNTINTTVLPSQYYGASILSTQQHTPLRYVSINSNNQPIRKYHNIHDVFSNIHNIDSIPINVSEYTIPQ